ncbi:polysaccharide deacetylase [Candidatus Poribacteria bacterium]|nr:polysaccharide deacetylase [Candidatus Poribacteria bacterium]|tara:strand:+ start:619 stop:1338 length:720 start_codon:yes stop_codon:yes gene_type:complete
MSLLPIPNGLVVLTFDDGNKSDFTYVAPLLNRYGFGATFYITEGLNFLENKEYYLTWEEVHQLHQSGFEIGNHTRHHKNVNSQTQEELLADLEYIDTRCQQYNIPIPETFCYPGYNHGPQALEVLTKKGMRFARRGISPEFPHESEGGRGPAYDPKIHHRLLIPTTGASGPNWSFDDFVWAVEQAKDEKIAILTFHGVPALEHPWVNTFPDDFKVYMDFLNDHGFTVIALRDLSKYIEL